MVDWVENVLKTFTFGKRRLFAWHSFRAHLVQSVKELFNKGKTDLLWNKPKKDQLREMYGQWMNEGPHTHTKGGNMRGPPLKQIVRKAWLDLDKEIVVKSFRCCALSIQDDGSEDNTIACLKPGKPLSSDLERLKAAMAEAAKELVDPFTESDIENDPDLVIDSDREEDEDVDIE